MKIILSLLFIFLIFLPTIVIDAYYTYFHDKLSAIIAAPNVTTSLDYYNQSYGSTLARMGIFLPAKNYYSVLIPLAVYVCYKLRNVEIAVILGLIMSFVSWQHYYVILFPIFLVASIRSRKIGLRTLILLTLFFFWWIEFPWLHLANKNIYTSILASHYFLSALGLGIYMFFLIRYEQLKGFINELKNKA